MVQRTKHPRFAFKTHHTVGISGKDFRKDFQGNIAIQTAVMGAIHLAHPACANCREDFIRAQTLTGLDGHGLPLTWNWQSITRSTADTAKFLILAAYQGFPNWPLGREDQSHTFN